jgi:hypothetical protein
MHAVRSRWVGVLLALTGLIAPPADASPRTYIKSICWSPEILEMDLLKAFMLPVGCELIDCCPGCPAADALNWRIRMDGKSVEAATLSFEGLADPAALKVEGAAALIPDGVVLKRGSSQVLNLTLPEAGRAPVAGLQLRLDPDFPGYAAGSGRGDEIVDVVELSIEQMLGSVAVNEFLLRYRLKSCVVPEPCDVVKLQGNQGADNAVVLLDGRDGVDACENDGIRRGVDSTVVGNVKTKGACSSSVVGVFSRDNAMAMLEDPPWTDVCGDEVVASLGPAWDMPVNLWLGKLMFLPDPGPLATQDLLAANAVYDENKTGIAFVEKQRKPLPTDPITLAKVAFACQGLGGLESAGLYVKDQLNVYYGPVTVTGQSCDDRNMVLIGPAANDTTLAHELGHALSLHGDEQEWGHSNDVPDMTPANIMWVGDSQARKHFSLGQAFRFNVNKLSMLNQNGSRQGPERDCPPKPLEGAPEPDFECPGLALDWSRP